MKRKSGLQKKLSSIFDGLKLDGANEPETAGEPPTEQTSTAAPKTPSTQSNTPQCDSPIHSTDNEPGKEPVAEAPSTVTPVARQVDLNPTDSDQTVPIDEAAQVDPFTVSAEETLSIDDTVAVSADEPTNQAESTDDRQETGSIPTPTGPSPLIHPDSTADMHLPGGQGEESTRPMARPVIFELNPHSAGQAKDSGSNEHETADGGDRQTTDAKSPSGKAGDSGPSGTRTEKKSRNRDFPDPQGTSASGKPNSLQELMARRQRRMKTLVGGLSITFVLVMVWALKPDLFGGFALSPAVDPIEPLDTTAMATLETIHWFKPPVHPPDLRDPMIEILSGGGTSHSVGTNPSQTGPDGTRPMLDLKGIVYSEDNPAVIIGPEIYSVNDLVKGVRIVSIGRDEVEFELNGEHWIQRLNQGAADN